MAHGRIKSVDTSAAKKIPGVFRVITAEDVVKVIPDPYYGPAFHDQPILAMDKVRFVGEPVAVVLAADPHIADAAVQAITAEYEELEPIYDEVEAMTSASHVHDELKPAASFADLKHLKGTKDTNLALQAKTRRGDVDKAFAAAAHVFEHEFRTQKCLHVPFEPFCSIADYKESGLTIYSGAQGPSFVRSEIARLLGWAENKVRIKVPYLGGGYGGKLYIKLEALVTACSMIARRPVKIALTMEEQFYQITKHPATIRIKSGVDKSGRITARKCEVFWNGGAYADIGPRVTHKSGFTAAGPYDIDNVWIDSYAMYTNMTPAGALRGFGMPQLTFAYESHTDMMARGSTSIRSSSAARTCCATAARKRPARSWKTQRWNRCWSTSPIACAGTKNSIAATAPSNAAAALRLRSRLACRRPPRSPSSMSAPTAARRFTSRPSIWGKAPTPAWRRSSARF